MSNTIRNLLVKVGVDISQYTTAINKMKSEQSALESKFRDTANSMDNWQATSQGLAARVSTLNDKIKLQKQIVDQLKQEYTAVATATGQESAASQKLEKQYIQASGALDKMNRELNGYQTELYQAATAEGKTGREAQEMGGKIKTAGQQTKGLKAQIKEFASSSVGQYASVAGAVGLATTALHMLARAAEAAWQNFTDSADWADNLLALSQKTGIATETLQGLEYAGRFVEVEFEAMQKGLQRVVKAFREADAAGKDYIEIANGLRVSTLDANGSIKSSEQIFYDAVDALGEMSNATEREAAAQDLFGKSYQEIMPLINAGSEALKKYADQAKEAGIVIDEGLVKVLGMLDDQFEQTEAATKTADRYFAATHTGVAKFANTVKFTVENLDVLSATLMDRLPKALQGMSAEEMDFEDKMKAGAAALGITYEEMTTKVTEMQATLAASGMDSALTQDEAFNLVIEGINAQTWAMDQLSQKQAAYDEQINTSVDEMNAKMQEYNSALASSTETYLTQMGDTFDAFQQRLDENGDALVVSGADLQANLNSQVRAMSSWSEQMRQLSAKGVSEGLIAELRDMGPKALPEIQALNSMTDSELSTYVETWRLKNQLAKDAAVNELKPLAKEVEQKIKAVQSAIEAQEAGMEAAGRKLASGVADGIDQNTYKIKSAAVEAARKAYNAALNWLNNKSGSVGNVKNSFNSAVSELNDVGSFAGGMTNNVTNINKGADIAALAKAINAPRSFNFTANVANAPLDVRRMGWREEINLIKAVNG